MRDKGSRFNKLNKDVDKIEEIKLKKNNQHIGLQIDKLHYYIKSRYASSWKIVFGR